MRLIGLVFLVGFQVLLFFVRRSCEKEFEEAKKQMKAIVDPNIWATFEQSMNGILSSERTFAFGLGMGITILGWWWTVFR